MTDADTALSLKEIVWHALLLADAPREAADFVDRIFDDVDRPAGDVVAEALAGFGQYADPFKPKIVAALARAVNVAEVSLPASDAVVAGLTHALRGAATLTSAIAASAEIAPMSTMVRKPPKPLGGKAYGSIGHLPKSRLGPGDWHVHEGQARICLERPRKGDRVICAEKLDGACMAVAKIDGAIVGLTRAGYRAADGAWPHLRAFDGYVDEHRARFAEMLADGERVCGEWMILAHGTRYCSSRGTLSPFLPFDIIRDGKRVLRDEFVPRVFEAGLVEATVLYDGPLGFSIEAAMTSLGEHGYHGAIDPVEGAVWRVEREGRVDFLAKYVAPSKIDGKYLPNISGLDPVWNYTGYAG